MKTTVLSLTFTGDWQQLSIPGRFSYLFFYNGNSNNVLVKFNEDSVYETVGPGETFTMPNKTIFEQYDDDIYVKGTAADSIKIEVNAENGAIEALS